MAEAGGRHFTIRRKGMQIHRSGGNRDHYALRAAVYTTHPLSTKVRLWHVKRDIVFTLSNLLNRRCGRQYRIFP